MRGIKDAGLKEAIEKARKKWTENKSRIEEPPVEEKGCELCDFTGWIKKNGMLERCECVEREVMDRKQKQIDDLIERYRMGVYRMGDRGRTFAHFCLNWRNLPAQEGFKSSLDKYIESLRVGKEGNLVLLGPTGSGKTWGASYIVGNLYSRSGHRELSESKYCAAVSWGRVLSALKNTFKNEEEHQKILDLLYGTEVLVIDDLGMEQKTTENYETSWSVSELYQMIDYRWDSKCWTIITTNKTEEEIKSRFGEAFYSRVFNTSFKISFVGEDHRPIRSPERETDDISIYYQK